KKALCPFGSISGEVPLIVQVTGVIVTVVLPPVVLLTNLKTQAGTPNEVAVGNETATETLPTYSTRLGEQSVGIIVSIVVVPITARPFIPGSNHAGNCPTPPDGTLVSVEAIPLGVTGAPNLSGVGTLFSTIISPRVV